MTPGRHRDLSGRSPEELLGELARMHEERERLNVRTDRVEVEIVRLTLDLEHELEDLQADLRLRERAIDASASGIMITDAGQQGHPIIYVNRAFERLTGYPAAEVLGKNCRFLQGQDRDQPGLENIRTALREQRDGYAELRNYRKDGTMFWNELVIAPIRDDGGRVTHFVGVQTDITRRKAAEAELEEANRHLKSLDKLRSNFFGLVSHELRTPLSAIVGFAEFLEDDVGGTLTERQQDFVQEIQTGARRLASLVDDLLDFARLEAGTFRLMPQEGDLCEKVREALEVIAPQASQQQLKLELELPPDPVVLCADLPRLGQVLINLLTNAMKFSPDGSQVRIAVEANPREVRVRVTDHGIGIAPEHVQRIFERFYQVEPTTTRAQGGAGLGLSIAKALVEAHGGQMGVESVPGAGSTFWFSLPRTEMNPTC
ncbi:MAG: histidine kinase [Cyanobacteria bacterium RYN_339]|nr:histidine kinase [Cyanobacteria bacterium RYN_339]